MPDVSASVTTSSPPTTVPDPRASESSPAAQRFVAAPGNQLPGTVSATYARRQISSAAPNQVAAETAAWRGTVVTADVGGAGAAGSAVVGASGTCSGLTIDQGSIIGRELCHVRRRAG